MIPLTHFIFGLTLAYILDKRLVTASAFALAPDFDVTFSFLHPFVHEGIMHSFLAAGVFSLLTYIYSEDRTSAESCFLGYSSHLCLDLLTFSGIPVFFPFFTDLTLGLTPKSSLTSNLAIIVLCAVLVFAKKHPEVFQPFYSWR